MDRRNGNRLLLMAGLVALVCMPVARSAAPDPQALDIVTAAGSVPDIGTDNGPVVLRVASAAKDSGYDAFVEELEKTLNPLAEKGPKPYRITNVRSNGSYDNIDRLARGDVQLAIVQSDAAHYAYTGKRSEIAFQDFRLLMPLYREYVQVLVRADSRIQSLADLMGKRINIGPARSGTRSNALDVLKGYRLREQDYQAFDQSPELAMQALARNELDAVFVTGRYRHFEPGSGLRQLQLGHGLLTTLTRDMPYYQLAQVPTGVAGGEVSTLSVMSYLIVSADLDQALVGQLSRDLIRHWQLLNDALLHSRFSLQLRPLKDALKRQPAPIHKALVRALAEDDFIESPNRYYWTALLGLVFVYLALWAQRNRSTYNRLGQYEGLWVSVMQSLINLIARMGRFVIAVSLFFTVLAVLVIIIQWVEGEYSRLNNVDNAFAQIAFSDAVLWVFTFMASGFTSGDMYPASLIGKVLIALLALVGVAGPLAIFLMGFESYRGRNRLRREGSADYAKEKGHVLICGWNDKVPGLVYSLTCDEVPEKKRIIIVAEMDKREPLQEYAFNEDLVSFCRGDSADHRVLVRAGARQADAAVVLAGVKKLSGRNVRSVLTAMALKKENPNLYLISEMVFAENQSFFDACGSDAIVTAEPLLNHLAGLSCFTPQAVDFLLDLLTHDEFSEAYSIPVKACIGKKNGSLETDSVDCTLLDAAHQFAGQGAHLLARVCPDLQQRRFLDEQPDHTVLPTLLMGAQAQQSLKADDHLVYLSRHVRKLDLRCASGGQVESIEPVSPEFVFPEIHCAAPRVLIVGGWERCQAVSRELTESAFGAEVCLLVEGLSQEVEQSDYPGRVEIAPINEPDGWRRALEQEVDCIVILSDPGDFMQGDLTRDKGELDARTVLCAKLAGEACHCMGWRDVRIVAEMINFSNRALFEDAEIDVIIPESLVVERFLAKLIYSRGVVSDLLTSLLSLRSPIFLHGYRVQAGDGFVGQRFRDLLLMSDHQTNIIAWRPQALVERLKNTAGDFNTHFVVVADEVEDDRVAEGDLLMLALRRS